MLKTVSSITNAIGALNYKGTWNASTNTPTLASGAGTKGDYYVVSVAGTTSLDGISNWGVGDWVTFNGSVWQRLEGGAEGNFTNLNVSGNVTLGDASTDTVTIAGPLTTTAGNVVINESGGDFDFRVESDTNTHALFVQGSDGNVGIGTSSPNAKLAFGDSGSVAFNTSIGNIGTYAEIKAFNALTPTNPATNIRFLRDVAFVGNDGAICFDTTNTERLRIDSSGNVGIGTSSPNAKLSIEGGDVLINGSSRNQQLIIKRTESGSPSDAYEWQLFGGSSGSSQYFAIRDNKTGTPIERLRIDSSGNLGLGVTPSAWGGSYITFQVTNSAIAAYNNQSLAIANNAYDSGVGAWKYSSSAAASFYNQSSGSHAWYTAPSGTAGSTATFTERLSVGLTEMVVNEPGNDYDFRVESDTNTHAFFVEGSSGNVGIGTSSPSEKLEVSGNIKTSAPTGGTAAAWKLGTVASVSPTSPDRTIEVEINGTTYYLHAKTTND